MSYYPKNKVLKRKPILFVHIPKTAGTSMRRWMKDAYGKIHSFIHAPISNENLKNLNMPSFTVIRNPYDRAFSAFKYRRQILEDRADNPIFEDELFALKQGFEPWVVNYFDKPWTVFDEGLEIYGPRGMHDLAIDLPQADWITINDKIKVDIILRYESIDQDLLQVQSLINYHKKLPKKNISTFHTSQNYRDFYTDKSKKIIEKLYEKDLDLFHYIF